MMTSAATDLAAIGSNLSAAYQAATIPTVALVPAAADEVSVGVAHLCSAQAQQFQGLAGQATAFHDQFVQTLKTSAGSYSAAEAAATASLQPAAALPAVPPGFLNSVGQWIQAAPIILLVLGFIGFVAIYSVVFYWLDQLGLLPMP